MAVLITKQDCKMSDANAWYRVESHNLGINGAGVVTPMGALQGVPNVIPITFANAGNVLGIALGFVIFSTANNRNIRVQLQEAITVGSFDTTAETVNINAHGFNNGDTVSFTSTGTLPTGITSNYTYYIVNVTTNNFQIATTAGGTRIALSGTPTGTATAWITRAWEEKTPAQYAGTFNNSGSATYRSFSSTFVRFDFSNWQTGTSFAVTTSANKYRVIVNRNGGTTGSPQLKASDAVNVYPFYAIWCDTLATLTDGDVPLLSHYVDIDKSWTSGGVLATGDAVYGTGMVIFSNLTDATPDNVCYLRCLAPVASYTLTMAGWILMQNFSGIRIGTQASPIPLVNKFSFIFANSAVGTAAKAGIMVENTSASYMYGGGKASLFLYGEVPNIAYTTLTADAAANQNQLQVTDTVDWVLDDQVVIGKQDVIGQGDTTIYQVQSVSGTTITLKTNLATNLRKSGGKVLKLGGYGVEFGHTDVSVSSGSYVSLFANFEMSGVLIKGIGMNIGATTYYYVLSCLDDAYTSQWKIIDCAKYTSNTTWSYMFTTGPVPPKGIMIDKYHTFRAGALSLMYGYYANQFASGMCEAKNCMFISNYSIGLFTAGNSNIRYSLHDCEIQNFSSSNAGELILNGTESSAYNINIWGGGNPTSQYGGVSLGQLINPVKIDNISIDKCSIGLAVEGAVSKNAVLNAFKFGAESPNTVDILFKPGCLPDVTCTNFDFPVGGAVIDRTYQTDMVATGRFSFTNFDLLANDDSTYYPNGIIQRCGNGLADTTVHTAGSTKYSMRFYPDGTSNLLGWSQDIPTGNIANRDMTITVWVKINNAAYWAGTNRLPRLNVNYDNGTTAYCEAAQIAGDWQKLEVPFTPLTVFGKITVSVDGYTDATGTNAYFYVDDFSVSYPDGYALSLSGVDDWANGLPVTPTISQVVADASTILDAILANHTVTGTVGKKLNDLNNPSALIGGKWII